MRPIRVVVADGGGSARSALLNMVADAGFELVGEAPNWDAVCELIASRSADVVLVSGGPDFASGSTILAGEVATLIVAPDAGSAKEYSECGAFGVVTPDVEPEIMGALAATAIARANDLKAARQEAESLRGMLETRKLVERAKGVLMRRLGVPEDVAYRRMQKASQDENRKMKDIADSILSAERLYGADAQPDESPL